MLGKMEIANQSEVVFVDDDVVARQRHACASWHVQPRANHRSLGVQVHYDVVDDYRKVVDSWAVHLKFRVCFKVGT